MQFCSECLYPANHPLNLIFDEDGVCSGCKTHKEKNGPEGVCLDWNDREHQLRAILDEYRSSGALTWDCVVPISGARDSYFIVDLIKNKYKLNPLLVTYNTHFNTSVGNRNKAYLQTHFDSDLITQTISPATVKKITRYALENYGNLYWHCLAGQTTFPVQVAVNFKIPLIIWGAHQGLEQVGMFSHTDNVEMTRKYRFEHDLFSVDSNLDYFAGTDIPESELMALSYPEDKHLESVGVRGIYLGNYIPWDVKAQHDAMIDKYGYETLKQARTFDNYSDADSWHYSGLHDILKYRKFGYGKITDHVCRELRWNRLTREEGLFLIEKYENITTSDIPLLGAWLDRPVEWIHEIIGSFTNRDIFDVEGENAILNDGYINGRGSAPLLNANQEADLISRVSCKSSNRGSPALKSDYVLIERGFVD